MDYTKITLGEILSSSDEIIRRNAMSILKQLQKNEKNAGERGKHEKQNLGKGE